MRRPPFARAAFVGALLLTGCPKSPQSVSPVTGAAGADVQIGKLARVLRAADRRIVDDDLRSLLADADAVVRAKAILALGQIGDTASLPDLDKAAADAEPKPRASAAYALGLIADPASNQTLVRSAGDASADVRAAAGEALGRLHVEAGADTVRTLLGDTEARVRAAACLAAWKFSDPDPMLDALIRNAGAAESNVRVAAAYALARLGSIAVAPPSSGAPVGRLSPPGLARARAALGDHGTDADPLVRMQVARGLASPQGASEAAIVGALSRDHDPRVRVNAVRALGYPGISVKPHLAREIADPDQGVARAALEAIGLAGGPMAVSELNDIVKKLDTGWLREAALLSLAHADPSRTGDIVSGLLLNPDPAMRGAAAALVTGRKEPGAIRAALALLGDPSPRVQALGVPLVTDQDGAVSKLLQGFVKSPDPVVRAAVAEAVGERFAHPHPAVETRNDLFLRLEEIWAASGSDPIPDAKLACLDAAAKAGKDDRTKAALTRALADPEIVVRRRAVTHFREVYDEDRARDVGPASDRPLEDYERIVRWSRVPHVAVVTVQRPGTATGEFTIALDAEAAPLAAWNFSELAGKSFFDGAVVHRVVPNFVVQDGDPRGDGFGGPGYTIRDEFNPLGYDAGVLGMASDGKDTAGSQWFVTLSPQPHLDGRYTSFGRVVRGLREIVGQIRPGDSVVSIRIREGNGAEPAPSN